MSNRTYFDLGSITNRSLVLTFWSATEDLERIVQKHSAADFTLANIPVKVSGDMPPGSWALSQNGKLLACGRAER